MKRPHKLQYDKRNGEYFAWIRRDGVRRYFKFGTNKREAESKLRQKELEIETGKEPFAKFKTTLITTPDGKKDMRIEELADSHLDWVEKNRAYKTYELRQRYVKRFLEFVGECMVSDINEQTIDDFYTKMRKECGGKPNSGNHALIQVKAMFHWAIENNKCSVTIRKFPEMNITPSETKLFSEGEFKQLVGVLPPDFRDMLIFDAITGLRPKELRELKDKEHLIKMSERSYCLRIEKHKTARMTTQPKPRSIPLSKEAMEIINRQREAHPDSEYIFLNEDGQPYTAGSFRQRLERWCKRAELEKRSPYALRHFFGTVQATENNLNQSVLAQLMGHCRLQTTDRYIANVGTNHKEAIDFTSKKFMKMLSIAKRADAKAKQNVPPNVPRKKTANTALARKTTLSP